MAAFIATHRFGLGPAPGEAELADADPRGWLDAQVAGSAPVSAEMAARPGSAEILARIQAARIADRKVMRKLVSELIKQEFRGGIVDRTRHQITTDHPLAERMAMFWSNHFTVSSTRRIIAAAIPAYEREAIRPHVFGRFSDMLRAVVMHPCMLVYLDNVASNGPNSKVGKRLQAKRGKEKTLNENLAREILELHTLGVNGGYSQDDVIELALAITGWNYSNRKVGDELPHGGFEFRAAAHEPGARHVLGKTYPEGGVDQGLAILDDLARHPATARHVATKLVRHFVSDDPAEADIDRIAGVFRETDGDLAVVTQAVIALDSAWADPLPKVKSHIELVIAAHRVTGQIRPRPPQIFQPLREMGQLPFTAQSPFGWGDRAGDWMAPEVLMRRVEWLRKFSATLPAGIRPDALLDDTIGPVANGETRIWVERAPSGDAAIAMVLASPAFQRR